MAQTRDAFSQILLKYARMHYREQISIVWNTQYLKKELKDRTDNLSASYCFKHTKYEKMKAW
jgi:hypothetical protein